MSKFNTRPVARPPVGVTTDALRFAEEVSLPLPDAPAPVEEPKRGRGRPKLDEADKSARHGFATRVMPDTLTDIDTMTKGLRLRSQGEVIERAVAFYKAHVIAKAREGLRLAPEVDDEAALRKAFRVDD